VSLLISPMPFFIYVVIEGVFLIKLRMLSNFCWSNVALSGEQVAIRIAFVAA
jgi:hypothetical protein